MFALSAVETFGSLGITEATAKEHARKISAVVLLEGAWTDKRKAEVIVEQVINLGLPKISDEQQVVMMLPLYGVSRNVTTLALNAIPPIETVPTPAGSPPTPTQQKTKRIAVAKKKVAGMTLPMKIALGVSVAALVSVLVLIVKKRREG